MINQVTIKIPYPKRLGVFMLNTKKKVSFSFDNLSMFIFREDNNIDTVADFNKWQKEHSDFDMFVYAAFSAAKSYANKKCKKFNLDIKKFALGLAQCDAADIERLTKVWKDSQSYGAEKLPGKKKAAKT